MSARTPRGEASIQILGLNLRESLIKDRSDAIEETRTTLLSLAVACAYGNSAEQRTQLAKLNAVKIGSASFAIARRYAVRASRPKFEPLVAVLGSQ